MKSIEFTEPGSASWRNGLGYKSKNSPWIPPTDDERRLFMEAAWHCIVPPPTRCGEYCKWRFSDDYIGPRSGRAIAESLALDGADVDNMPDFEELE